MSAQPANTDITVKLAARSQRRAIRHEVIAALTNGLRPLQQMIPGNENEVGVLTRDTTLHDFSPYMGQAKKGGRGFPVVYGLIQQVSFANAQVNTPDVDFAFAIGHDRFLKNTDAGLDGDMYRDLRALTPDMP